MKEDVRIIKKEIAQFLKSLKLCCGRWVYDRKYRWYVKSSQTDRYFTLELRKDCYFACSEVVGGIVLGKPLENVISIFELVPNGVFVRLEGKKTRDWIYDYVRQIESIKNLNQKASTCAELARRLDAEPVFTGTANPPFEFGISALREPVMRDVLSRILREGFELTMGTGELLNNCLYEAAEQIGKDYQ